jgi:hypothetical protein
MPPAPVAHSPSDRLLRRWRRRRALAEAEGSEDQGAAAGLGAAGAGPWGVWERLWGLGQPWWQRGGAAAGAGRPRGSRSRRQQRHKELGPEQAAEQQPEQEGARRRQKAPEGGPELEAEQQQQPEQEQAAAAGGVVPGDGGLGEAEGAARFVANLAAVRSAHVLVVVHGAGGTNAWFMRQVGQAGEGRGGGGERRAASQGGMSGARWYRGSPASVHANALSARARPQNSSALLELRPCKFGTKYASWCGPRGGRAGAQRAGRTALHAAGLLAPTPCAARLRPQA